LPEYHKKNEEGRMKKEEEIVLEQEVKSAVNNKCLTSDDRLDMSGAGALRDPVPDGKGPLEAPNVWTQEDGDQLPELESP
jgi:hypothetical protein